MKTIKRVLVTGGAGYVGSVLVPKLLDQGYHVTVLDLFIYGSEPLNGVRNNPNLVEVNGDIRDRALLERTLPGHDAVIHLACISNDPSFELDADLGKSINYDAFFGLVDISKDCGVSRFVYASSSSVYGIKDDDEVTENLALTPLTDYSKYKALCEEVLLQKREPGFTTVILRPATVCGYSPRLRLDLIVNILTNHAINNRQITVFGGQQMRPNIHIDDVTDLYVQSLEWPVELVDGQIFNAGYDNHRVVDLADLTKKIIGDDVAITSTPTDDLRSYHISSKKIKDQVGFVPVHSIEDAVGDLVTAYKGGRVPNSLTDSRYYNIKMMQSLRLK